MLAAFGVLVWLLGSVAVSSVAGRWRRSAGGYLLASFVFSPLLAGLVLVASGEGPAAQPRAPGPRPLELPPTPGRITEAHMSLMLAAGALVSLCTVGALVWIVYEATASPVPPAGPAPRRR